MQHSLWDTMIQKTITFRFKSGGHLQKRNRKRLNTCLSRGDRSAAVWIWSHAMKHRCRMWIASHPGGIKPESCCRIYLQSFHGVISLVVDVYLLPPPSAWVHHDSGLAGDIGPYKVRQMLYRNQDQTRSRIQKQPMTIGEIKQSMQWRWISHMSPVQMVPVNSRWTIQRVIHNWNTYRHWVVKKASAQKTAIRTVKQFDNTAGGGTELKLNHVPPKWLQSRPFMA